MTKANVARCCTLCAAALAAAPAAPVKADTLTYDFTVTSLVQETPQGTNPVALPGVTLSGVVSVTGTPGKDIQDGLAPVLSIAFPMGAIGVADATTATTGAVAVDVYNPPTAVHEILLGNSCNVDSCSNASPNSWWLSLSTESQGEFGAETSNGQYQILGTASMTLVPLPAAAWLLLSGLGGLGVFARKRLVT